jgi:hypothetical protein
LFNLKKKVKNKAHVEASICEAYIVKKISTFISYYFKPQLRTRINRVPKQNDDGEVPSSGTCQYSLILKDICLKENSNRHIIMCYLIVMN